MAQVLPNTGFVETIYFNNLLNTEEVQEILSTLSYVPQHNFSGRSVYVFYSNSDQTKLGLIAKSSSDYQILFCNGWGDAAATYIFSTINVSDNSNNLIATVGWQDRLVFEINAENVSEITHIENDKTYVYPVGVENDKLINMLGLEPYIKPLITDKVLANTGYVGKVYFNTKLSIERMRAELNYVYPEMEKLGILDEAWCNYIALFGTSNDSGLLINRKLRNNPSYNDPLVLPPYYEIVYHISMANQNEVKLFNTNDGWNTEVFGGKNYIEFNQPVSSSFMGVLPVGSINDKLTNIITADCTELPGVPNTGYIEKIYFNNNLSIDEVHELFSKLTFITFDEGVEAYFILASETFESGVIVMKNTSTGQYQIVDQTFVPIFDSVNGWNIELDYLAGYDVNSNVASAMEGVSIGAQNYLLENLVATSAFVEEKEKVYRISASSLKNIADAIRFKNGTTTKYNVAEMPEAIKLGSTTAFIIDGSTNYILAGQYQGTDLIISENTFIDLRAYLDKKEVPLDIQINVPIPDGYLKPEGTFETNIEGTYDVTTYASVTFTIQKEHVSVTPTEEVQTLIPSENVFYSKVIVEAIPSEYIVPNGSIDITNTEEVDVTQYAKAQIKDENLKEENIAEGVTVLDIKGTHRGGVDTSDADATSDDILLGKSAYVKEQKVVGTIETYDYSNSENSAKDIISNYISQINYIEGTGTQYLITNYVATSSNITLEAKIQFTDLNIKYAFWLHNIGGSSLEAIGLGKSDSNYAVAYSRKNGTQEDPLYSNTKLEENVDYEIKAIYDSTTQTKTLYLNGELQKSKTYTSDLTTNTQQFMLFYSPSFPIVSAKMYYVKIYSDNQLVVYLVPCIRKHDNIVGMFDLISATFYKSSGTEEFIGG